MPGLAREVLDRDVLELRGLADEELRPPRSKYAGSSGRPDTYSSISVNAALGLGDDEQAPEQRRLPAPCSRCGRRAGCSRTTPCGTTTSRPCFQSAAFWAANLSSIPTSVPSSSWSSSGSNVMPSGARADLDARLADVTNADAPSSSSIELRPGRAGCGPGRSSSGSNPARSVKRQCSSFVVGTSSERSARAAQSSRGAYLRCSISALPSGSWKKAMWQTPVSKMSPSNSTPACSSAARASATSATRSAMWPGAVR